jgi:serine/threonine protein kinase
MANTQEGMTLGAYRIISQIGKGGMATVYKAYQASMDRYVALKVLPQYHSEDPSFTQRFIQEARTIARLEHRNILPVYDFGEEDGVAYMAMRYLDGGTLQDILALGELPLNETIEILRQICAGLDYAHRQGVVHRDVKPANVMIDGEGGVYLTDFGLAKVLEGSSNLTMSGMVMGTPLYMAPEQSVGEGIDGRADIYAAGVILYEMVTGQPPFQAETPMAIVLAHLHEPLPLPKEINPAVPDEIQRVILKALAKDPEDRYQTAREMSEQLSEVSTATDTTNNTPTLQFLATEARNSLEEKVILPTDKNFTPVSAKTGIPVSAPPSRGKIIANIITTIALIAIAVFLGVSIFKNETSAPAPETDAASSQVLLYDDFNDQAYEGNINTKIWQVETDPACTIVQDNGTVVATNETVDYGIDTCDLIVGVPEQVGFDRLESLEAKIFIAKTAEKENDSGHSIMFSTSLPSGEYWYGLCGAEITEGKPVASFWVARVTTNGTTIEDYYASTDIQTEEWHTYYLKIDREAGVLSCFLDDALIGSTVLEHLDELRGETFKRGITAWRLPNASAITKADDFRLHPNP